VIIQVMLPDPLLMFRVADEITNSSLQTQFIGQPVPAKCSGHEPGITGIKWMRCKLQIIKRGLTLLRSQHLKA
jgi:hypothetical protein